MKKNLRIVSAAAAALLAVAPVAATAVPVNAAANNTIALPGSTTNAKGDITLNSGVQAVTYPEESITNNNTGARYDHMWNGKLSGAVSASYKGQNYTVNLANDSVIGLYREVATNKLQEVKPNKQGKYRLEPGRPYYVLVKNASINMTTANANLKDLTLGGNGEVFFFNSPVWGNDAHKNEITIQDKLASTIKVNTNQNGGVFTKAGNLGEQFEMLVKVIPTDVTNNTEVHFFERATGNEVQNGSLNLKATNYKLNVQTVLNAAKQKYSATQETYNDYNNDPSKNHQFANNGNYTNSGAHVTTTVADLTAQLEKAGIKVDALGNFDAPASFNFNLSALSDANKATKTLPITVSVEGAKEAAVNETTTTKTVMHIATIYDKHGKATNEPVLRAYNSVSVVSTPVTLKDANGKEVAGKFYKLAGKDQYIKVGNIDGTERTLKHNSYVYKSNGKARTHKVGKRTKKVLKRSGSSVRTYGKSFMIHGSQMWRIGRNQYIKVRNF